jgi:hypothetical protein
MIDLTRQILQLKQRAASSPLSYFRPTPPQLAFLKDPSPIKLLLGGNQIGKTRASVMSLLYRALGCHPYLKTDPVPNESWLITHSHDQSRTIQKKLYEMIPHGALMDDCVFVPGKGFRGQVPIVRFKNGSIIRIKTAQQGIGLESASIGFVAIDEPIPESVWGSLASRVLRGGSGGKTGTIAITMTPVGEDVSYLRHMVEDGRISCHRAPLTVPDTTPIDCDPLLTQQQIDNISATYLPIDREARLNGSWDVGIDPKQLIFDNFDPSMISGAPVPAGGDYKFAIGIDHGSQPNSQVAILSAVDMTNYQEPKVYVLGEYTGGASSPEHHVRGILEMLKRHHVDPSMCTWTGDGAHYGGRGKTGFKMSNGMLMRAFERVLSLPPRGLPFTIRTALKFKSSVYYGSSVLYSIMSKNHFYIRPECTQLIQSLQRYTFKRTSSQKSTDPHGHAVDALRYGVLPVVHKRFTPPARIRMY